MWKLLQAIDWWSNMWTYQTEQDLKLGVQDVVLKRGKLELNLF